MLGFNTLLLSKGATTGSFACLGMALPINMGPALLRGIRATITALRQSVIQL